MINDTECVRIQQALNSGTLPVDFPHWLRCLAEYPTLLALCSKNHYGHALGMDLDRDLAQAGVSPGALACEGSGGTRCGSATPPYVLRGVNSQNNGLTTGSKWLLRVHWARLTCPNASQEDLVGYLTRIWGTPERLEWGRFRYDRCWRFPLGGVCLYYDHDDNRSKRLHGGRLTLDVPGKALDLLRPVELEAFCGSMLYYYAKCTRLDLAADDLCRRILPDEVAERALDGELAGFRVVDARKVQKMGEGLTGNQVTFGRRGENGAGKVLRVYDKALESDGLLDAIRWEAELSGERAEKAFFKLSCCMGDLGEFCRVVAGYVTGTVDFVDRKDKNLSRAARCAWWAAIVEELGRAVLRSKRRSLVIDDTRQWLETSVGRSLALVRESMGEDEFAVWLESLVEYGADRLRAADRALLDDYSGVVPVGFPPGEVDTVERFSSVDWSVA